MSIRAGRSAYRDCCGERLFSQAVMVTVSVGDEVLFGEFPTSGFRTEVGIRCHRIIAVNEAKI
jgi:hypothetical protein